MVANVCRDSSFTVPANFPLVRESSSFFPFSRIFFSSKGEKKKGGEKGGPLGKLARLEKAKGNRRKLKPACRWGQKFDLDFPRIRTNARKFHKYPGVNGCWLDDQIREGRIDVRGLKYKEGSITPSRCFHSIKRSRNFSGFVRMWWMNSNCEWEVGREGRRKSRFFLSISFPQREGRIETKGNVLIQEPDFVNLKRSPVDDSKIWRVKISTFCGKMVSENCEDRSRI